MVAHGCFLGLNRGCATQLAPGWGEDNVQMRLEGQAHSCWLSFPPVAATSLMRTLQLR